MELDEALTPQEAAGKILDLFNMAYEPKSNVVLAVEREIDGMLKGIASGRINKGQTRLAEQLIRFVEILQQIDEDTVPDAALESIEACARFGLTADGQDLSPSEKGRSHANRVRE